jgi:DNA polymerase-3 subunit chi
MTEVSFYHLQRQPLEQALPKLLGRVLASGRRAVVMAGSPERVQALNALLWTYDPASFLPHGARGDGFAEDQPIFLTEREERPNGADVLALVDGVMPSFFADFARCLDLFDGNDPQAVEDARSRWRTYKEAGCAVTYWQQSAEGRWEKKA